MPDKRLLESVEPKEVFYYFENLTKIPRCSGNEGEVAKYIINFAKEHGFEWYTDKALNVVIKKPATKGYETRPTVILQGHTDMVCEKNEGTVHDFEKDPIKVEIEGDKVIAKDTTLGADDGMGVAFALALLADKTAEHPPIELVCTSDEERGMAGVEELDTSILNGRILINLDADDEGKFVVGCAGGPVVRVEIPVERTSVMPDCTTLKIQIKGLKGGHSGEDIHRGRANSNKLLIRLLNAISEKTDFELADISGGLKYNAIPREAEATFLVKQEHKNMVFDIVSNYQKIFNDEFRTCDPDISVTVEELSSSYKVLTNSSKMKIMNYLYFSDSGIIRMNPEFPETVESSVNLGVVRLEQDKAVFQVMTRSSVESMYTEMYKKIVSLARNNGGSTFIMSNCPEWEYDPDSKLKSVFENVYKEMFNKDPELMILHAGLECGVFAKKIPEKVDMIAAGPDVRDLHTPGEYVTISSVQNFWKFFKEVIKSI